MTIHRKLSLGLLVLAELLAACASTTIRSIHRSSDFRSDRIRQVLVIGMLQDQIIRKALEEEFVRQWSLRGVRAVSSLAILPSSTTLDKAGIAPIAKAQGFDSVLVIHLLEKKTIN